MITEDRICLRGETCHHAHAKPVLGHVGETEFAPFPRTEFLTHEFVALQPDFAAARHPNASERLEQFRLAVPCHTGDADDFTTKTQKSMRLPAEPRSPTGRSLRA